MNLPLSNLLPNGKHADTQLSRRAPESIMATLPISQLQAMNMPTGHRPGPQSTAGFPGTKMKWGMVWAQLRPDG